MLEAEFTKFVEGYDILAARVEEGRSEGIFQASEDTEMVSVNDCLLTVDLKKAITAEKWETYIKHSKDP